MMPGEQRNCSTTTCFQRPACHAIDFGKKWQLAPSRLRIWRKPVAGSDGNSEGVWQASGLRQV
jgi:hypothetical protein